MSVALAKETGLMGRKLTAYMARGGKFWTGSCTFDSSYPLGGESLAALPFTPSGLDINPRGGYIPEWDKTNNKLKLLTPGVDLIVEEVVTIASHVGTLKHKPFYILAVESTATTTTGPFSVIPAGETPLTVQCAVNFATGGLTFVSTDLVTSVRVTYIPLHETGPFSSSNLVIDEAVVAAIAKTDLAYQAAAVQYVWDDTDTIIAALEPVGEAPSATHTAVVDIDDGSNDTNIDSHTDDEGNSLKVTYIKYGTFPPYCLLGDGDLTLASEIYNFTTNHYNYLAIPGLGTACIGEATADNVALIWSGPSSSKAAGVPVLDLELNQWSIDESSAVTTLAVPVIFMPPNANGGAMMEAPIGEDLSSIIIDMRAWQI